MSKLYMGKKRARRYGKNDLLRDVDARQRNTVWPDTIRNSVKADGFLWFGTDNPTIVQRVGCGLFGGTFLLAGLAFMTFTYHEDDVGAARILFVIGAFFLVIGGRIFWNAIRE